MLPPFDTSSNLMYTVLNIVNYCQTSVLSFYQWRDP